MTGKKGRHFHPGTESLLWYTWLKKGMKKQLRQLRMEMKGRETGDFGCPAFGAFVVVVWMERQKQARDSSPLQE